jgi:hypothetical protein
MADKDDDDNVIRFPPVERIVVDAIDKLGFGQFVLINRTPVAVDMVRWSNEFALRSQSIRETGVDPWRVAET